MASNCFRRNNCRLCGNHDLSKVLSLTPTPPANAFIREGELDQIQQVFPLDLHFCNKCRHVQLLDVVDPSQLFSQYIYVSGTSSVLVQHFERYALELCEIVSPSNKKLAVDIGSNDGTLLGFLKKYGMSILGIDPATKIANQATHNGIPTINSFFNIRLAEKIRNEYQPAAIITANNVFAHADNLKEILQGVHHLLDEDGIFVFEVSYLGDVVEKTLFDTIYHEHLAYHSVSPLVKFFSAHDLEIICVKRTSPHGGSIRCTAQRKGGAQKLSASVKQILSWEESRGLLSKSTYTDLESTLEKKKNSLTALLSSIRSKGGSIVGFGAPAKATTLMYHFDIGPETIQYIVDDSPLKVGLHTPGLHIPVKHTESIYQDRPDFIIILAWNFAESIIQNHDKYRRNGGKFIIPLPELRII